MTQQELENAIAAIDAALQKGERTVTFADRSVTYRSTQELLDARAAFQSRLGTTTGRPKLFAAYSSKAL